MGQKSGFFALSGVLTVAWMRRAIQEDRRLDRLKWLSGHWGRFGSARGGAAPGSQGRPLRGLNGVAIGLWDGEVNMSWATGCESGGFLCHPTSHPSGTLSDLLFGAGGNPEGIFAF